MAACVQQRSLAAAVVEADSGGAVVVSWPVGALDRHAELPCWPSCSALTDESTWSTMVETLYI